MVGEVHARDCFACIRTAGRNQGFWYVLAFQSSDGYSTSWSLKQGLNGGLYAYDAKSTDNSCTRMPEAYYGRGDLYSSYYRCNISTDECSGSVIR